MSDLIHIPFHGTDVLAVEIDGKPHVVLKPAIEALGLDFKSQHRKIAGKSWASVVNMTMQVPGDTQRREMTVVDVRTFLMLLATVSEAKVSPEARPLLVAYQSEVADAIEAYWTKGGAINPRADEHQVNALIRQAQMRIELCQAAKGLIHADHLEARARIVLARGLGEHPELDAAKAPLYTHEFLKGKNLSAARTKSVAGIFGKRVKKAYIEAHGCPPEQYPLNLANGQVKNVNAYTEEDRSLMDQVWQQHYAEPVAHKAVA